MLAKYSSLLSLVAAVVAIYAVWYVTRWDLQWFLAYCIVALTIMYVASRCFAGIPSFRKPAEVDDIASDSSYVDLRVTDMAGIGLPAQRLLEAYDKMQAGGYDYAGNRSDARDLEKLAEQEYP